MCRFGSNKRSWPVNKEAESVCNCLKRLHFSTELGAALKRRDTGHGLWELSCSLSLGLQTPKWAVVTGRRGGRGRIHLLPSPGMPTSVSQDLKYCPCEDEKYICLPEVVLTLQ